MSRTIEEVKRDIAALKERIMIAEIGNDSYYLSRDYKEHQTMMYYLTMELKKLEKGKQPCQK